MFFILIMVVTMCRHYEPRNEGAQLPAPVKFDLDSIQKRGKLILLTENSATSYYLYRGQAKGYDYEMVKAFARHLGVELEVKLLDDVDRMFEMLNRGEGDLIATNLTATRERKKNFAFSPELFGTRQVLVQKKIDPADSSYQPIKDTTQLAGLTIWVHRYSSFYSRLIELQNNIGGPIKINEAPGELSTDDLIRLCAAGEIDYTVTDENLAMIQQNEYPNLDMSFAITEEEEIAWALRKNSKNLLAALNAWIHKPQTQKLLVKNYRKYFNVEERIHYAPVFVMPNLSDKQISPYDSLFRKYAPEIGWDWRLLAALVYQESRFTPSAESWSGAFGLMQLMPETALKFGCDTTEREEPNIRAGVKYLKYLDRIWRDRIPNKEERLKFVLASYNIGPGHVFDAQCIASKTGMKDTLWENNVAECMLLKTQEKFYTMDCVKHGYCYGKEPYHFVGKILSVYNYYVSKGIQ